MSAILRVKTNASAVNKELSEVIAIVSI